MKLFIVWLVKTNIVFVVVMLTGRMSLEMSFLRAIIVFIGSAVE